MLQQLLSPSKKRKRSSSGSPGGPAPKTTPVKKLREKLDAGRYDATAAPDAVLAFRAVCDAVISVAAAADADAKAAELRDLDELIRRAPGGVVSSAPASLTGEERAKIAGTPLFLAASLDCPEAARSLLAAGARVTAPFDGVTPLEAAFKHKSTRVAELFLEKLARLEEQTTTTSAAAGARQQRQHATPVAPPDDDDDDPALASPSTSAAVILSGGSSAPGGFMTGDEDDDLGARAPVDDDDLDDSARADDAPRRPLLERAWTHTSVDGRHEQRLHSVERASPAASHRSTRSARRAA